MTRVSVIGLGAMGSAIARALASAGHALTVWNHCPDRMGPFAATGTQCAKSACDCVAASTVVVICIDDELPRFADRIVKCGMRAGLADEEIVSRIKLLRDKHRD
jgi:3-hydroxyisobutyrate dehydrogenase-like beta-hydroxyacid dehydrogenase